MFAIFDTGVIITDIPHFGKFCRLVGAKNGFFAKCYAKSTTDEARERGLYPYFRALESRQDIEVIMEGKRRIMLGSNNYLGLTTNPEIMEAGIHAIEQWKMTSKTAWSRLRQALTSPGSP